MKTMAYFVMGMGSGALMAFGIAWWTDRGRRAFGIAHLVGAAVILAVGIVMAAG